MPVELTMGRVMTAALQVVDTEGLEALTMRRLWQVLDHDPMALYQYAANRAALRDGVAAWVLSELVISTRPEDWREQLRSAAHDFRRLALAHPNVVPLLVTRPLATRLGVRPLGTLRLEEELLDLLVAAGFPPTRAVHASRTFFAVLCEHVLVELQEVVVRSGGRDLGGITPDKGGAVLLGLHRLPARPRSVAPGGLAGYDGAAELDEALDLLLAGMSPNPPDTAPKVVEAETERRPHPVGVEGAAMAGRFERREMTR